MQSELYEIANTIKGNYSSRVPYVPNERTNRVLTLSRSRAHFTAAVSLLQLSVATFQLNVFIYIFFCLFVILLYTNHIHYQCALSIFSRRFFAWAGKREAQDLWVKGKKKTSHLLQPFECEVSRPLSSLALLAISPFLHRCCCSFRLQSFLQYLSFSPEV